MGGIPEAYLSGTSVSSSGSIEKIMSLQSGRLALFYSSQGKMSTYLFLALFSSACPTFLVLVSDNSVLYFCSASYSSSISPSLFRDRYWLLNSRVDSGCLERRRVLVLGDTFLAKLEKGRYIFLGVENQ